MIETLQSLRFVFVMLVVLSHFVGEGADSDMAFGGPAGVCFFFVLSGFVLSLAYGRKAEEGRLGTGRLLFRQLSKFYPLHIVLTAVAAVLETRLGHDMGAAHILPVLTLAQSWIPSSEYYFAANEVSWFLSDIVFFYLLFAPLCRAVMLAPRSRLAIVGAVFLAFYAAAAALVPDRKANDMLYVQPLMRLADFVLGIVLFRLYSCGCSRRMSRKLETCSQAIPSALQLGVVGLTAAACSAYAYMPEAVRCASLFWPAVALTVYVFAMTDKSKGLLSRALRIPLLTFLGSISFEIYLTHMLIRRILGHYLVRIMGPADSFPVQATVIMATIAAAWMLKKFFVGPTAAWIMKHATARSAEQS